MCLGQRSLEVDTWMATVVQGSEQFEAMQWGIPKQIKISLPQAPKNVSTRRHGTYSLQRLFA
eukprot:5504786-Amphidinium_carterae.1